MCIRTIQLSLSRKLWECASGKGWFSDGVSVMSWVVEIGDEFVGRLSSQEPHAFTGKQPTNHISTTYVDKSLSSCWGEQSDEVTKRMNLWRHKIQEMLRLFFLAFHRARIALCWIGLESQSLTFVILSVHLFLCLYSGDIATCDGVGGVEGPPSPPVVGIRVAPEVLGVPPAAPEVLEVPPASPEVPVLLDALIPDPQREAELYSRFWINTFGENPTLRRISDTISVQSEIDRLIEAALIHSGFNPTRGTLLAAVPLPSTQYLPVGYPRHTGLPTSYDGG
ncbi:hypothetical protein MTR_2g040790 [Medicago truncatula]|uniref:Uncharacterized protein n=1 Tax=Medicago truncatula TaxID=3880 RepID=A0A072VH87_MEDTR|nr:hypothetical protein MTR_2g040790 [Medicago truncatula]